MVLPLVVGVDGSEAGLLAVDWAVDEAARLGLPLRLLYASLWELYEGAARQEGPEGPAARVMPENILGPARKVLLRHSAAADLVIIGARRRHGHFGLQLSRVGHTLLHHADCPVAIVPQLS
ncbi:universal stress protein [Streptomyces atriruber]|uniref:universal stress protein n=1 Tax=Streptomyces atriruber TaxID=545121 RepID=UPI00099EDAA7|nr:universal stress protein [Streptomyces atriruber]